MERSMASSDRTIAYGSAHSVRRWPTYQWRDDGTGAKLVKALRERIRVAAGREPTPSAACIDSQSVEFIPIKPLAAMGSGAPGSYAGHNRVPSRDRGRRPS